MELWRYGHVGVLNTIFGYSIYAALVYLGLNLFAAQMVSWIVGAAFNYVTYGRLVFRGTRPKVVSFAAAYAFNYLLAVTFLAIAHRFIASPYLAGLTATVIVAAINYLVLKRFVFRAVS